jgi:hypothetical protein
MMTNEYCLFIFTRARENEMSDDAENHPIWAIVRRADQTALERLVEADQDAIYARGHDGECPIHMLVLYGSETHLNMAKYLITKFLSLIMQSYNRPVSTLKNSIP